MISRNMVTVVETVVGHIILISMIITNKNLKALTLTLKTINGTVKGQLSHHTYLTLLILPLFIYVVLGNLMGTLPYSYTITAQFVISLSLSLPVFVQFVYLAIRFWKTQALVLLLPEGVPLVLSPLLIFIEGLSIFSRIISLSVRLTANMISGHTLVKMIASGLATLLTYWIGTILGILPLSILLVLFILEVGIAVLQGYVFILLTISYYHDSILLH